MKAMLLSVLLLFAVSPLLAQQPLPPPAVAEANDSFSEAERGSFHEAILKAMARAVDAGDLEGSVALRLRVALLAPAFRHHAENMAWVQLAFSGSANTPFGADGKIDRSKIKWSELDTFNAKLIPLLNQLLEVFGV